MTLDDIVFVIDQPVVSNDIGCCPKSGRFGEKTSADWRCQWHCRISIAFELTDYYITSTFQMQCLFTFLLIV